MPPRKRTTKDADTPPPAGIDAAVAESEQITGDDLGTAEDEPKRGPKRRKPAKRKPAKRGGRKKSLREPLRDLLGALGLGVSAFNEIDGRAILGGADNLADALDKLAKENDSVYRVLDGMLQTSAWGGVAMAAMPIVVKIADNHGLFNGGRLASVSPLVPRDDDQRADDKGKDNGAAPPKGPGPIGTPPPAGPITLGPDDPAS